MFVWLYKWKLRSVRKMTHIRNIDGLLSLVRRSGETFTDPHGLHVLAAATHALGDIGTVVHVPPSKKRKEVYLLSAICFATYIVNGFVKRLIPRQSLGLKRTQMA